MKNAIAQTYHHPTVSFSVARSAGYYVYPAGDASKYFWHASQCRLSGSVDNRRRDGL
jgi:hypothetical protein